MMVMNITESKRKDWIDIGRGIAMIFIVVGHCVGIPSTLRRIIFSFHVPFFFILSGYTYHKKEKSVRKDFLQLIVPYIITVIFVLVFNVFRSHGFFMENFKTILKSAFYGFGSTHHEIQSIGAIWFLLTMFFARRIMNALFSIEVNEKIRAIPVFLAMWMGIRISEISWIPLNLDLALVAAGFMYIGYCIKLYSIQPEKDLLIGCLIVWFASLFCGNFEMAARVYAPWLIHCIGAVGGSVCIMALAMELEKNRVLRKSISFIGRHTILLLCIHDLDWRSPFGSWWGFLAKFKGTPFYFPVSVGCRVFVDFSLLILIVLIGTLIRGIRKSNANLNE